MRNTILKLFFFIIALMLAAFFSGTETAFISARRFKLKVWKRRKVPGAEGVLAFLQKPEQYLTTTLVGTNIAIVTASSLMALLLEPFFSGVVITIISASFLLFFGEILPKSIALKTASTHTLRFASLLKLFYYLLYPINIGVMSISTLFVRLLGQKDQSARRFFTRQDLDILVREGERAGLVDEDARGMISRFLLHGDYKVKDVMIPRTQMAVVRKRDSLEKVISRFNRTGYSRFPVIDENIDHVIGVASVKDVVMKRPGKLSEIIRETLFVPESLVIGRCLRTMQKSGVSMAIAVDEYGGTAGLVTLEDIFEEFFGDIQDEFDDDERLIRPRSENEVDVHARIDVDLLREKVKLELPEGEYQTLGGLLIDQVGEIPKRGVSIRVGNLEFIILSASGKRIGRVRIRIHPENEN